MGDKYEIVERLKDHCEMTRKIEDSHAWAVRADSMEEAASTIMELAEALEPFADLSTSYTVRSAVQLDQLLTITSGDRMCGIDAKTFDRARSALSRLKGTDHAG